MELIPNPAPVHQLSKKSHVIKAKKKAGKRSLKTVIPTRNTKQAIIPAIANPAKSLIAPHIQSLSIIFQYLITNILNKSFLYIFWFTCNISLNLDNKYFFISI